MMAQATSVASSRHSECEMKTFPSYPWPPTASSAIFPTIARFARAVVRILSL